MRLAIPGLKSKLVLRLFERVETVNDQYDIFDVGLESPDGVIDSLVVGGSFSSAKQWLATDENEDQQSEASATVTVLSTEAASA
tara:strand:+ start:590 stop:841 length:252 start_codon:yes stop_codon:yes gene_type:complete